MPELRFDARALSPERRAYVLQHLPSALGAAGDAENLRRLARCEEYLEAQASHAGAGPLATLRLALESAIDGDRAADMAALAVSHARWTAAIRDGSPLEELRTAGAERARAVADLGLPERRPLWYLLLAWELADEGDRDSARAVLGHLRQGDLPLLQEARSEELAADLLASLAGVDAHAFTEIGRQLLGDHGRGRLSARLVAGGRSAVALEVAAGVESEYARVLGLLVVVAGAEPDVASMALDLASQTAASIADDGWRATAMAKVAEVREGGPAPDDLAGEEDAGHGQAARDAIAAVLRAPPPWEGGWWRPWTLAEIARVQARAGHLEAARRTLAAAGEAAGALDAEDEWTSLARRAIAEAQAEMGDNAAALATASGGQGSPAAGAIPAIVASLVRAGQTGAARRAADAAAAAMPERIDHHRTTEELAVSMARAGDPEGALRLAERDFTRRAEGRVQAVIVDDLLRAGDLAKAHGMADEIVLWTERWPAFLRVASAATGRGDEAAARAATDAASRSAMRIGDGADAVAALAEIARTRAAVGDEVGAGGALAGVPRAMRRIDIEWKRDQARARVAAAQVAAGDADAALATALAIPNGWFRGEALLAVAMRQVAAERWDAAEATVARIEAPHWHALALAASAIMWSLNGRNVQATRCIEAAEADIRRVPEGEPRTRLREALAGVHLELRAGREAAELAAATVTDRSRHLAAVAQALARAGDRAGFKRLLLEGASYLDAAHRMAALVALLYPDQAAAIAAEFTVDSHGGA